MVALTLKSAKMENISRIYWSASEVWEFYIKIHPVLVLCVCFFWKSLTIGDECHLPLRATKLLSTWGQNHDESTVTDFEFWQFFLGGLFLTFLSAHDCWNDTSGAAYHQTATTMYHIPREHSGQHRCLFWLSVQLAGLFRCLCFSRHLYKQRAGWEWHTQMCQ